MRIFSFWRVEGVDFWPALERAAEASLAARAGTGVTACLENEAACFVATSADLADAAGRFASTGLRFIWDPGNSTRRGFPPRRVDFAAFADRISSVHVKDGSCDQEDRWSVALLVGEGGTDYPSQLRWLEEAGYDGALTLEPHYCPGGDCTEGMRRSIAALQRVASNVGVDLLLWLVGDVDSVFAFAECLAHKRLEVEDTAVPVLRFASGALGMIEAMAPAHPAYPN